MDARDQKFKVRDSEMVHWVKAHAAKPEGLSLIPRPYMLAGENWLHPSRLKEAWTMRSCLEGVRAVIFDCLLIVMC